MASKAKSNSTKDGLKGYLKQFLDMPNANRDWVLKMGLAANESKFNGSFRAADIEQILTELAPPTTMQEPWSVSGVFEQFLAERANGGPCYVSKELRGYKPPADLILGPELHRRRLELESHLLKRHSAFLVMTDIHTPFQCAPAIDKAIAIGKREGATAVIIGGDFMDLFSFSRFIQDKQVSFEREIEEACTIINKLLANFSEIAIIPGNHEARMKKALAVSNLSGSLKKYIDLDPIDIMRSKLAKSAQERVRYLPSWWMKLGDAVVAHPSDFSGVQMRTAENVQRFFTNRRFDLDWLDFKHSVIGHSHHAGKISWNGVELFESGCLTWTHDYHEETGRLALQPWALACTVLKYNDIQLDITTSNVHRIVI